MARLARDVHALHRALDVVARQLQRTDTLVRHVAVRAAHTALRMHPLAPQLELRVLHLEALRAGLAVFVIGERLTVGEGLRLPNGLHVLHAQPLTPRELQDILRRTVVFDVALPTHERAHLLAARVFVRVVGTAAVRPTPALDARDVRHRRVALRERLDPAHETRSRDPDRHGVGRMAIDAAHRVHVTHRALGQRDGVPREFAREAPARRLRERPRGSVASAVGHRLQERLNLAVRPRAELFEAADHGLHVELRGECSIVMRAAERLAPDLAVEHVRRSVAMQTGARLRLLRDALGDPLIVQHVRMAPRLAVIEAERVPRIQAPKPRMLIELRFGQRAAAPVEAIARGLLVRLVVVRKVGAPRPRIRAELVDLGQPEVRRARFLLALQHAHEHPRYEADGDRARDEHEHSARGAPRTLDSRRGERTPGFSGGHGRHRCGSARTATRGPPRRWDGTPRRGTSNTPTASPHDCAV